MINNDLEQRFAAVERLQSLRKHCRPGSFNYERADYAIDLALNPTRKVNDFLFVNCLRDAGRILKRRAKAGPVFVPLDTPFLTDGEEDLTLQDVIPGPSPTPAELCSANDFVSAIGQRTNGDGTAVAAALDAMVAGESATVFAERTGLSESYFKKLRKMIRTEANNLN